jgi:hypothetical protein
MSDTSSSLQAQGGGTTKGVLLLGEKIVQSLRQDDLLSRWMAHHISERMTSIATAGEEERAQREDEVADLILRLWEHGRNGAFDADPIQLSDNVMRAVAKLDPEPEERYFRAFGFVPQPLNTETVSDKHLDIALLLDRGAGDLVRELVTYAAAIAEDQEQPWISVLGAMDADPIVQLRDLMVYVEDESADGPADSLTAQRLRIATQAARLSALLEPLARNAPAASARSSRRRFAPDPD